MKSSTEGASIFEKGIRVGNLKSNEVRKAGKKAREAKRGIVPMACKRIAKLIGKVDNKYL